MRFAFALLEGAAIAFCRADMRGVLLAERFGDARCIRVLRHHGERRRQGDADAGVTEIGVAHHSPSVSVQQGAGQDFGARQMCPAGVTR